MVIDPNDLPKDIDRLHEIVVELCERLKHETSEKDKYRSLLRELVEAQRNRKSEQLSKDQFRANLSFEQLSKDQLALFEKLWKARHPEEERQKDAEPPAEEEAKPEKTPVQKRIAAGSPWRGIWSGSGSYTI